MNFNAKIACVVCSAGASCIIIIIVLLAVLISTGGDIGPIPLGEETRVDNAYVGLFFLNEDQIPSEAKTAFLNAAARWSKIVSGTSFQTVLLDEDVVLCGNQVVTTDTLVIDHLMIAARVAPIDGINNILGQAGPCIRETSTFFPVFGIMDFDLADIGNMIQDNIVEPVILHEMGHVLGIGTLWGFAIQGEFVAAFSENNRLLSDPVFTTGFNGNLVVNSNRQPKFIGTAATSAFSDIGGSFSSSAVPVEDGTLNGEELFGSRQNGVGSIDSHWDEDFMPGELMEFRIGAAPTHPLSVVSILSLQDVGYTVDITEADSYSVNTAEREFKALPGKKYQLVRDVVDYSADFMLTPEGEILSIADLN